MDEKSMPKRHMIQTPEGQIEYRELGEGKPLLLLHGLPQSSRQYARHMWRVAKE